MFSVKIAPFFLVLLFFHFSGRENCCNNNIKIKLLNTDCFQLEQANDLLFEVENTSDNDFYTKKSFFLYNLNLLDNNGNTVKPFRLINEDGDKELILLKKQQKTKISIPYNFSDRFLLNNGDRYTLLLEYYNTQKKSNANKLLTGKYTIPSLIFSGCQ